MLCVVAYHNHTYAALDLQVARADGALDIGAHYVATLQAWRRNIATGLPQFMALGYQPDFLRLWDFYLCYCEGGFLERSISDVHLLFAKPGWRGGPVIC